MSTDIGTRALAKCPVREARSIQVLAGRRRAGHIDPPLERSALVGFDRDLNAHNWRIHSESAGLCLQARQLVALVPQAALRPVDALPLNHARHHGAREFATANRDQAQAARALGFTTHTLL